MPTNVDVPPLGESVREAVLIKWHKNDGDTVTDQEPIAELETDKANVDVPAPAAGVLRRVKKEGDTVTIGETIARIEEGAGSAAPAAKTPARGSPAAPPRVSPQESPREEKRPAADKTTKPEDLRPSVRRIVDEQRLDPSAIKGTGPGGKITKED